MTKTVAAFDHRFPNLDPERGILDPLGATVLDLNGLEDEDVLSKAANADAVMIGPRFQLDSSRLKLLKQCRLVVRYGVGVDNVDLVAAERAGIEVAYVPDYCVEEVSNHALAMMLALHRQLLHFDHLVRAGHWSMKGVFIPRLSGCVLGVIGYGRIGREVAKKSMAFGIRTIVADPYVDGETVRTTGAEPVPLARLLRVADIVSLHTSLTATTRTLLDRKAIYGLKRGALLVNVARAGLVDESALAEALREGHIGGAAVDITQTEPPNPDSPLLGAPNLLITPHIAWYSEGARAELQTKAAEEVARMLRGEPVKFSALSP